jgi:5-hydroxyisourate hydrolase
MNISTHVLDGMAGIPAIDVTVLLERRDGDGTWRRVAAGQTDNEGRMYAAVPPEPGMHRLTFGTGEYFAARGVVTFYPEVAITFEVTGPDQQYHVPLLLSPYAYSTYRGS